MLFMLNMHLLTVDTPTYGSRKVVVLSPNVFCGKNPLDFIAGFSFWQKKKEKKISLVVFSLNGGVPEEVSMLVSTH